MEIPPHEIASLAKQQVQIYNTVEFFNGLATKAVKNQRGHFEIQVESGQIFRAEQIIFATGIKDVMLDIDGLSSCWGISALHCPFCHGYEVRDEKTGILGNGDSGFDLARLISNWTKDLTLFTNGTSTLTDEQTARLTEHHIQIVETEVERLNHTNGYIKNIVFRDATQLPIKAIYAPVPFEHHCQLPESLGCELTDEGYIRVNSFQETSVEGVFACGDNTTRMRTVANAVAMGTTAGMTLSKKMIFQEF